MRSVTTRVCAFTLLGIVVGGCGAAGDSSEPLASTEQATALNCERVEPKDVLIAQLMRDSWLVQYPLTRLVVDPDGAVTGLDLPELVAGDLELINLVPEARDSVARAVSKLGGVGDYTIGEIGPDLDACPAVPAWTPEGPTIVSTTANELFDMGDQKAWKTTQKEFAQECALIKTNGNHYIIDPPGDGSTNDPPSETVSAWGVQANAFGLCPSWAWPGLFCKLSYATGAYWTGRRCQTYWGALRCLLS